MRRLTWIVTLAAVAVWSGLCWIAHGLIGIGGNLVAGNADILPADPLLIEWASWLANAGTGVGEWLIVALWAVVSAALLALGFVVTRLLPQLKLRLQNQ